MRSVVIAIGWLLIACHAYAYSGNCAIWAHKRTTFTATNFGGTQAGYDSAKVYVGTNGAIFIYGGCEGAITIGTLSDSVFVYSYDSAKWLVFGKAGSIRDRSGTARLDVDSIGVRVTGVATVSDTLRVAGRLDLNNALLLRQGADIASAATITFTNANAYTLTGTTTSSDIAGPAVPTKKVQRVTFYTAAAVQITAGNHWKINGNFNGNGTGNKDSITVDWDGTDATEVARVIQ